MNKLHKDLVTLKYKFLGLRDCKYTQLNIMTSCYFRYTTTDCKIHEVTATTPAGLLGKMQALYLEQLEAQK